MNNQSHQPVVSVVMSMRNSASTVAAAVQSVLLQTWTDWELIVIDNGSSDGSAAIVAGFDDPRIHLVREMRSTLLATRLNQAVALSRGKFIARMDADDICFPERLERQVAWLQRNPEVDVVGCGAIVFKSDAALIGQLPIALTHKDIVARPFAGFPLPHPTWCGRADWFHCNPYSNEPITAEDQDLLLRVFQTSRFASLDEVLFGYRQDRLSLQKLMEGRAAYIGSLWRWGWTARKWTIPARGIAMHIAKGGADFLLLALGLNKWAQSRRLLDVPPGLHGRWSKLCSTLGRDAPVRSVHS